MIQKGTGPSGSAWYGGCDGTGTVTSSLMVSGWGGCDGTPVPVGGHCARLHMIVNLACARRSKVLARRADFARGLARAAIIGAASKQSGSRIAARERGHHARHTHPQHHARRARRAAGRQPAPHPAHHPQAGPRGRPGSALRAQGRRRQAHQEGAQLAPRAHTRSTGGPPGPSLLSAPPRQQLATGSAHLPLSPTVKLASRLTSTPNFCGGALNQ